MNAKELYDRLGEGLRSGEILPDAVVVREWGHDDPITYKQVYFLDRPRLVSVTPMDPPEIEVIGGLTHQMYRQIKGSRKAVPCLKLD